MTQRSYLPPCRKSPSLQGDAHGLLFFFCRGDFISEDFWYCPYLRDPLISEDKILTSLEGILKQYPEIGNRPIRVLSNPPEGSIEPLKRFYQTPFWPTKRFYRTPVKGSSEPQKRFCRTFRIEPPPFQVTLLKTFPNLPPAAKSFSTRGYR